MVLDSQVQTPSGCRFKMRLPLERIYLSHLFSSGCPADSPNKGFKPHQRH